MGHLTYMRLFGVYLLQNDTDKAVLGNGSKMKVNKTTLIVYLSTVSVSQVYVMV